MRISDASPISPAGARIAAAAALVLLLCVPLVVRDIYRLDLGITVLIWASLATAWNISGGFAGGLSLGHAAFFGVGAYTSTLLFLRLGITPWIGIFAGAVLAAMLGALLGVITFRLKGPFFVLATLAFGIVVHIINVNWRGLTRGAAGLLLPFRGGPQNMLFLNLWAYWYTGLGLLVLTVGVSMGIERSRLGYYLVALREDEDAARSLGVRVVRSKVIAAAVSAALAACAGSVYAAFIQYIDPDSTTQFELSVQIALVAIVGGMGTTFGPVLGAAIVIPLGEMLRARLGGGAALVVYGFLLMVIVLTAPNGAIAGVRLLVRRLRRLIDSRRKADA
ncbi:MAG: branched-chain amino acid ABC transporter permease [Spirochaetaceae bacterium]|nr:MAG: branched-chain amino acid ABC transporter permease [Spirochaetaceae bacterium]